MSLCMAYKHIVNTGVGLFDYFMRMGFKENLKAELAYSGMLVKELSALSGVNKFSIDNYLNKRGQMPSVEAAVKIARVLNVSVEYLVTGEERARDDDAVLITTETRPLLRAIEALNQDNRAVLLGIIGVLHERQLLNEEKAHYATSSTPA